MIPIASGVSLYEPGQKAILAWNGREEIMILSTDVASSQETLVVEILPLPSKPDVEAASTTSFEQIQRMIWQEGINRLMYDTLSEARSGSVEVVFHEKIGAHNITIVTASSTAELNTWIHNFLESSGVNDITSLGKFESVIGEYMARGFRYYVLDLITVTAEEKSVDPIFYRFNSDFLYYPLVITTPVGGTTKITLFTLTKEKLSLHHSRLRKADYLRAWGQPTSPDSHPIEFILSVSELSKIDLRVGEFFHYKAWLTVLEYEGQVNLLNEDLMMATSLRLTEQTINVDLTLPTTAVILCFALGAAASLIGVVVGALFTILYFRARIEKKEGMGVMVKQQVEGLP
jgi:hypothetical protein